MDDEIMVCVTVMTASVGLLDKSERYLMDRHPLDSRLQIKLSVALDGL